MAALQVRKLGYALGASVTGVDLREDLDDATIAQLRAIWLEHVVLCFPGQRLNPAEMSAICGRFGELSDHHTTPSNRLPELHTVKVLSNQCLTLNGAGYGGERSGLIWHTDNSYTENPATATFLLAQELPDVGGNTGFANMYAAYDALSPALKSIVDGLDAIHDHSLSSNFRLRSAEEQAADRIKNPPVVHPAVRIHPETGRKAIYVNPRVRQFAGMSVEESKPLLDFLNEHSTRYEFTYRHAWTIDDLVMWDNRCAMHIAVQDFDRSQTRRMLRCTIVGPKVGTAVPAAV